MVLSSTGCKVPWALRGNCGPPLPGADAGGTQLPQPRDLRPLANAGPEIANCGKADRRRCASPEPLYLRCLQIDSTALTARFHFASIGSVIPQPTQEIPAAFQGLGFPNLLPIVPNRRCLRASITSLFACQVYICEVSGRCSRSTTPAR